MSLQQNFRMIKHKVENKVFVLSKLRSYLDQYTPLTIYKQAVIPYFEYCGFMLILCTAGQKSDAQIIQNTALRIVKKYFLVDRVRIERLHAEYKILGLEQRRHLQMLKLMWEHIWEKVPIGN